MGPVTAAKEGAKKVWYTATTPVRWVTRPVRGTLNWLVDKPSEFLTLGAVWEKAFPNEAPFFVGRHAGPFALGKLGRLTERGVTLGLFAAYGLPSLAAAGAALVALNPLALGGALLGAAGYYLCFKCAGVLAGLAVQTPAKMLRWAVGGIERLTLPHGEPLDDLRKRPPVDLMRYSPLQQPKNESKLTTAPRPKVDFNQYSTQNAMDRFAIDLDQQLHPEYGNGGTGGNWLAAAQSAAEAARRHDSVTTGPSYTPTTYAPGNQPVTQFTIPTEGQQTIAGRGDTVTELKEQLPHAVKGHGV
jgi:hypothetical protein